MRRWLFGCWRGPVWLVETEAVPENRERKRLAREADRRRRAEQELRLAAATASYAAAAIGNGLAPEDARQEAIMAAGELEAIAAAVRRLARLDRAGRIALAALLRGQGLSTRQIALRVGVCERAVRSYLARTS